MKNKQLGIDFLKPCEAPKPDAKVISILATRNQFLTSKILSFKRPEFDDFLKISKK